MGSSPAKSKSTLTLKSTTKNIKDISQSPQWLKKKYKQITTSELTELSNTTKLPLESIQRALKYLEQRNIFIEKGVLGKGGYGIVLKAFSQYNDLLAVKFSKSNTPEDAEQNHKEFLLLQKFDSPYITKVYDFFQQQYDKVDYQAIVMERCQSDLKDYISKKNQPASKLNISRFYSICNQLAKGLRELHSKNIIHLDIKPANILEGQDNKWKYADLGVSKIVSDSRQFTNNMVGLTEIYSSPEQYQKFLGYGTTVISKASDIYSLGIVFLELSGEEINRKAIMKEKNEPGNISKILNPLYAEFNNRVLKKMLQYKPEDRIDIKEIIQIIKEMKQVEKRQKRKSQPEPLMKKQVKRSKSKQANLTDDEFQEINLYDDVESEEEKKNPIQNKVYQIKIKPSNSKIVNRHSPLPSEPSEIQNQQKKFKIRYSFQDQSSNKIQNEPKGGSNLKLPTLSPQPAKLNHNQYYEPAQQYSNYPPQNNINNNNIFNTPFSLSDNYNPSFQYNNPQQQLNRGIRNNQQQQKNFLPQIKSASNLQQNRLVIPQLQLSNLNYQQQISPQSAHQSPYYHQQLKSFERKYQMTPKIQHQNHQYIEQITTHEVLQETFYSQSSQIIKKSPKGYQITSQVLQQSFYNSSHQVSERRNSNANKKSSRHSSRNSRNNIFVYDNSDSSDCDD